MNLRVLQSVLHLLTLRRLCVTHLLQFLEAELSSLQIAQYTIYLHIPLQKKKTQEHHGISRVTLNKRYTQHKPCHDQPEAADGTQVVAEWCCSGPLLHHKDDINLHRPPMVSTFVPIDLQRLICYAIPRWDCSIASARGRPKECGSPPSHCQSNTPSPALSPTVGNAQPFFA